MRDAFSECHPVLNFFYFCCVLGFTMFVQHPVFLIISFLGAITYGVLLSGWRKVLRMNLLFTLPGLLIVALLNPMFNHYGVTPLYYFESSGNWVTLEALVYGLVLGCVMFIVILWFSCCNKVMTSDKFIYIFGKIVPALSLILSMALRLVPRFGKQMQVIRNGQKCSGRDISNAGLLKKMKYGLNILSILVTWALENAIETADSMKSRGYGLKGRTTFSIFRFDKRDKIVGTMMVVLMGIFFYGCLQGAAFAQYNPQILISGITVLGKRASVECSPALSMVTFVCFAAFCFLPSVLGLWDHWTMEKSRKAVCGDISITYRSIYEELAEENACHE